MNAKPLSRTTGKAPRSPFALTVISLIALLMVAGLLALGVWQVQRRAWKHDLIARVDARVHAAPVAAPGPDRWKFVTAESDGYRRVTLHGQFLNARETLTQASTVQGSGYWVMTPLVSDRGFTILVNRGFVPADRRDPASHAAPGGAVTVTGLIRMTEPRGGFLRTNDPAAGRWYSRDVQAIGAARGIEDIAPYFLDAEANGPSGTLPVGGLTVIGFPDNHLVYALTWFALAAMVAGGYIVVMRWEWRSRRAWPGL